jgi:hypothetical protein
MDEIIAIAYNAGNTFSFGFAVKVVKVPKGN